MFTIFTNVYIKNILYTYILPMCLYKMIRDKSKQSIVSEAKNNEKVTASLRNAPLRISLFLNVTLKRR